MDKDIIKTTYPMNFVYEACVKYKYKYYDLSKEEKEIKALDFLNNVDVHSLLSVIDSEFLPREQEIIKMRFSDYMTYVAIGEHYGLTSGRISEIVHKTLRKIIRLNYVERYLLNSSKHEDCGIPYISLNKLNVNTRTLNCLKRKGYNCVDDLIGVSLYEIDHIYGMGEKSIDSLLQALKEFDIGIEENENGELFTTPIMTKENCFNERR